MTDIQNPAPKKRRILLPHLSPLQQKLLAATGLAGSGAIVAYAVKYLMENHLVSREALESGALPPACTEPAQAPATACFLPDNAGAIVTDEMDFPTAFKTAREDCGPGNFFEWRGRSYNTFFKEEFDALSEEQKSRFYAAVRESLSLHPHADPVAEHIAADAPADETQQDDRFPTHFSDIHTNGERISLDQDGDGVAESVAVDDNRDGYVDRFFTDTDGDGRIDRYLLNADDQIDIDQIWTRSGNGEMKVLEPDKSTEITMAELQKDQNAAAAPVESAPTPPPTEFLAEKHPGDDAPPPEPGAIHEDYVAIDPADLAPVANEQDPEDPEDELDDTDSGHARLPGLENHVDPHL